MLAEMMVSGADIRQSNRMTIREESKQKNMDDDILQSMMMPEAPIKILP